VLLALGCESYGVGARGQMSGRARTRGMDQLSRKCSRREIFSDDAVVGERRARLTGFEPAVPKLLTLGTPPVGQTLDVGKKPSESLPGCPPGSVSVPLSPGGASEAVKLDSSQPT